jgi:hypothetical protein
MSGSYATVTADQYGRVTSIMSGTAPVTSVAQGTGISITGGTLNGGNPTGTISLGTAGTPGTYVYPSQIVTDVHGRVTSVTNGSPGGTGTVTSVTTGTGLTGGPITTTGTISLSDISGVQGGYMNPTMSVDGQGRITFITNGTMSGSGTVTNIMTGAGLTGGPITSSGTISMPNVGTAATYTNPSQIITDAQGRVSSVTNGVIPIASISAGTGMSFTTIDSTNPSGSVSLSNIPGVQGGYSNPTMSVDGQGRITFIANGTMSGSGTVTNIMTGAGLTGGPITTTGTISMPNVGTAGSGTIQRITVDAQGRVTSYGTFTERLLLYFDSSATRISFQESVNLIANIGNCNFFVTSGLGNYRVPGACLSGGFTVNTTYVNAGCSIGNTDPLQQYTQIFNTPPGKYIVSYNIFIVNIGTTLPTTYNGVSLEIYNPSVCLAGMGNPTRTNYGFSNCLITQNGGFSICEAKSTFILDIVSGDIILFNPYFFASMSAVIIGTGYSNIFTLPNSPGTPGSGISSPNVLVSKFELTRIG